MKKDLSPQGGTRMTGSLGEILRSQGVSRRSFMKFCATTASLMALRSSARSFTGCTAGQITHQSEISRFWWTSHAGP